MATELRHAPDADLTGAAPGVHAHAVPTVARLSAAESQIAFRAMLDATARPGQPVDLGSIARAHAVPPALVPALALADIELRVAIVESEQLGVRDLARLVRRSTGAAMTDRLAEADLVVALAPLTGDQLAGLRRGDALRPELGARLILACDALTAPAGPEAVSTGVRLTGPGARAGRLVGIDGVAPATLAALGRDAAIHPAGIDTWLVAADGRCVGIPRSCTVELVTGGN